jgi:hypothetical protein
MSELERGWLALSRDGICSYDELGSEMMEMDGRVMLEYESRRLRGV